MKSSKELENMQNKNNSNEGGEIVSSRFFVSLRLSGLEVLALLSLISSLADFTDNLQYAITIYKNNYNNIDFF